MNVFGMLNLFSLIGELFRELVSNRRRREFQEELIHEQKFHKEFKFAEPIKYQPITKKLNGKLILKWYYWDRNPNSYQNKVNLTACSSIIKSEFLINSSGIPKRGIYS
jgi:hypothetical protein